MDSYLWGLLGYRVRIIHQHRQSLFSAVRTREDWRQLSIGQGFGWSDVGILSSAGFRLVEAKYESLFRMVEGGRFDCFLRGVNEAIREVSQWREGNPNLVVEQQVMLVYPFAMFFFVARDSAQLAQLIERGLKAAYDDGSFISYFETHPSIRQIFDDVKMHQRRRFDIDNPTLSDETRTIPARYWYGAVH